jgi:hypothetical protein
LILKTVENQGELVKQLILLVKMLQKMKKNRLSINWFDFENTSEKINSLECESLPVFFFDSSYESSRDAEEKGENFAFGMTAERLFKLPCANLEETAKNWIVFTENLLKIKNLNQSLKWLFFSINFDLIKQMNEK